MPVYETTTATEELRNLIDQNFETAVQVGEVVTSRVMLGGQEPPLVSGLTAYDVNTDLTLWTTKNGFRYAFMRYEAADTDAEVNKQRELKFAFCPQESGKFKVFALDGLKLPPLDNPSIVKDPRDKDMHGLDANQLDQRAQDLGSVLKKNLEKLVLPKTAIIEAQRANLRAETRNFIDSGIEELVLMLNLSGIDTIQSCEGHIESESRDLTLSPTEIKDLEHHYIGAPYVEFLIHDDTERIFESDREQEIDYYRLCLDVESKMLGFLSEFYQDRETSADTRLHFYGDGSYRLKNQGSFQLESVNFIDRPTRLAKLHEFQAEISAFADFLRTKFIED